MHSLSYFESIATLWNNMRKGYFAEELIDCVVDQEKIEGKVVADLGAGTGFLSHALAEKAQIVFSIDQSRNMLGELKVTAFKKGLKNIYPIIGSFYSLPLFDQSVDHVYTNMALHHVEDPQAAIKEMFRVLKPEGELIISDVEAHDGRWAREEMFDVWLGFEHHQIQGWLKEAGFTQIEVKSSGQTCRGVSKKGEYTETGILIARAKK